MCTRTRAQGGFLPMTEQDMAEAHEDLGVLGVESETLDENL